MFIYTCVHFLQVAGVPGVTETLFLARQSALAQEKKSDETPMLYSCGICGKGYRSSKAHAQHLQSKSHLIRASEATSGPDQDSTIIRPLPPRVMKDPSQVEDEESDESEWEEVDPEEDAMKVDESSASDMDEDAGVDPSSCFMCDLEHDAIESCMVHMHKQHGFFIPDVEYLKDPKGLLTYLSLKVSVSWSFASISMHCFYAACIFMILFIR